MSQVTQVKYEDWKPLIEHEDLPKVNNRFKKRVTARLLQNQLDEGCKESYANLGQQYLCETAANASGAFPANTNLKGYDPILIGMVRRSAPNNLGMELLGVQPMTGPTGLIFAIRSKYSIQGGTEALFNEANTAFSGKGTHAGTNPMPQANDTAYTFGTGLTTAEGEALGTSGGGTWAEMSFAIESVQVKADTRGLKAEYTHELQQDLMNIHGLSAEEELIQILSAELDAEQNRQIVRTIYHSAVVGAASTNSAGLYDLDVDSNGRWSVERFKGLHFQIELEANAIAQATRRGRGNFLVTSADVASALSIAGLLDCNSALKDNLSHDGVIENPFVGVLNGRFKVYVDPYAPANSGYCVVGYKGASAYDAGLFFCPYVPLIMVKTQSPDDFQPRIGFKTRYGMKANPFAAAGGDIVWNTNVYYRKFQVSNLR